MDISWLLPRFLSTILFEGQNCNLLVVVLTWDMHQSFLTYWESMWIYIVDYSTIEIEGKEKDQKAEIA